MERIFYEFTDPRVKDKQHRVSGARFPFSSCVSKKTRAKLVCEFTILTLRVKATTWDSRNVLLLLYVCRQNSRQLSDEFTIMRKRERRLVHGSLLFTTCLSVRKNEHYFARVYD